MNDEDSLLTMRPDAGPALGRIDQYELVRKLGGGGFGVVYLARDSVSGVEFALKTLHPLLKHSPEEMESLREKFALVARLAHPGIATAVVLHPVRDIDVSDEETRRELRLSPGDSLMVMRYAPGVTLSKWRCQFPGGIVPLERALDVGRQIASALDFAHGEKIVHRDVKPGNVMVETLADGAVRVRLLDFGLAAEIRSSMSRVSTEQGDTSGTRPYMAPEQWLGRRQDGRTDQYALACVLYELLSGAPPFAGVFETGDPMIMLATVKSEAPEPVSGLDAARNAALRRALSKSPEERFPTCGALMDSLGGGAPRREEPQPASPVVLRVASAAPAASAQTAPAQRVCLRCGTPNAMTASFCTSCGAPMGASPAPVAPVPYAQAPGVPYAPRPPAWPTSPPAWQASPPAWGAPAAAWIPPAPPAAGASVRRNPTFGRCKHCRQLVRVGLSVCPRCGKPLKWGDSAAAGGTPSDAAAPVTADLRVIADACDAFATEHAATWIETGSRLSNAKLSALREHLWSLRLPTPTIVCAMADTTLFRSGKNGLVFGTEGVWAVNGTLSSFANGFVRWGDFCKRKVFSVKNGIAWILPNQIGVAGGVLDEKQLLDLLSAVRKALG